MASLVAGAVLATADAAPVATTVTRLKIGDTITVQGTHIACYALVSNRKPGIGCVILDGSDLEVGTYGVGIAADGTVILNQVRPDGSAKRIFRRVPQSARRSVGQVYVGKPDDEFVLSIDANHLLACRVVKVSPGEASPLYVGTKIGCWRTTGRTPTPSSDGVQISERFASVYRFDAKGEKIVAMPVVKRQP